MKKKFLEGRIVRVIPLSRRGTFKIEVENGEGTHILFRRSCGEDGEIERLFEAVLDAHDKRVSVRYENATFPWGDNLMDYLFGVARLKFKPYREIPKSYLEIVSINQIFEPSDEAIYI